MKKIKKPITSLLKKFDSLFRGEQIIVVRKAILIFCVVAVSSCGALVPWSYGPGALSIAERVIYILLPASAVKPLSFPLDKKSIVKKSSIVSDGEED